MRLEQLVYIKEIERQQSISKAAQKLFISQPSLSIALNNLEQELAVPIFVRSKQGVTPTLIGQVVLNKVGEILDRLDDLSNINQLHKYEIEGNMTVSLPTLATDNLGYYLISYFQENYPKIHLKLLESNINSSIQQLNTAQVNLAIVNIWAMHESICRQIAENNHLTFDILAQDELGLFVNTAHPLAALDAVTLEDLAAYPVSAYSLNLHGQFGNNHVLDFLQQGVIFDNRAHLKKFLLQKPDSVIMLPKQAMRDDIYIQTGKVVSLNADKILRQKILIVALISERPMWVPAEKFIYQELCDCAKNYYTVS